MVLLLCDFHELNLGVGYLENIAKALNTKEPQNGA